MAIITITNVQSEVVRTGKRPYTKLTVDYVGDKGPAKKTVMDFSNPAVAKALPDLVGKTVEVVNQKDEKDFWQWVSIKEVGGGSEPAKAPGAGNTRPYQDNRETPAERAARQIMIVKQSSLKAATDSLTPGAKAALNPDDVIKVAQIFTDWVLANDEPEVPSFDDVPNF